MTIIGENFSEPSLVSIDSLIVTYEPIFIHSQEIKVDVLVEPECLVGDYDVKVFFKNETEAKGTRVFRLVD